MTLPPFDPGLQPERTELSWRRTLLAISLGALVLLRLLPDVFGSVVWMVPGVLGLAMAFVLWSMARRRYHQVNRATGAEGVKAILPDGRLTLLLTVFVTCGGLLGFACVIALVLQR